MGEKTIALATTIVMASTYFTGFCYLYFYFGFFGITPMELDLSIQYVFVHAFPAYWLFVKENFVLLCLVIFFILVVIAIFYMLGLTPRLKIGSGLTNGFIIASLVIAFLISSYNVARYSGRKNAEDSLINLKVSSIVLENDALLSNYPFDLKRVRHVLRTESTLYVLTFSGNGQEFWLLRVPTDIIATSRTYMD